MADIYDLASTFGDKHKQDEILPACGQEYEAATPEELSAAVDRFATLDESSRAAVMDLVKEMLQERFPELKADSGRTPH